MNTYASIKCIELNLILVPWSFCFFYWLFLTGWHSSISVSRVEAREKCCLRWVERWWGWRTLWSQCQLEKGLLLQENIPIVSLNGVATFLDVKIACTLSSQIGKSKMPIFSRPFIFYFRVPILCSLLPFFRVFSSLCAMRNLHILIWEFSVLFHTHLFCFGVIRNGRWSLRSFHVEISPVLKFTEMGLLPSVRVFALLENRIDDRRITIKTTHQLKHRGMQGAIICMKTIRNL